MTTRKNNNRKFKPFNGNKRFTGKEMKFADTETSGDAFAVTWATMENATNDSVSGVALGDGESNRDGRVYWLHSIHIKVQCFAVAIESNTAPLDNLSGRFCLVWDKQTNGAQLTATDVMDGGQTDDILSFRNLQFSERFDVLWDRSFVINRNGQTNEGSANLFASGRSITPIIKFNRKFKTPIKVVCTGTDATISSISDNSLHVIGVADSVNAQMNMQIRLRFTS